MVHAGGGSDDRFFALTPICRRRYQWRRGLYRHSPGAGEDFMQIMSRRPPAPRRSDPHAHAFASVRSARRRGDARPRYGLCERLETRVLLSAGTAAAAEAGEIFMDPGLAQKLATPRFRRAARGYYQSDVTNPGPSAPPVSGTIESTNFDTDGVANNGFYHIPPDPHGAAGPAHVVSILNSSIRWHTKAGASQVHARLGKDPFGNINNSFFEPLNPANDLFDPKILYDQYEGRFVVVTLERQDVQAFGDPVNGSRILIAVSDDSDPNGPIPGDPSSGWRFQAIDAKVNITGADRWADYPGLAVDGDAVYVTANMFSFGLNTDYGGSRLWIVGKGGIYDAAGTSGVARHDPSTAVSLGDQAFTLQPAHMFGAAPGATGTFLVSSGFADGAGNEFLSVIRVEDPLGAGGAAFTNTFVALGNVSTTYSPPGSPQAGGGPNIDSGDGRIYNAVWRNNFLWAVNTVSPTGGDDAGTATAHWYKVAATGSLIGGAGAGGLGNVADQGDVGGNDIAAGTRTFYPAVNVDANGNMALGFGASGPNIFPGAYYTGRAANAPAGTVQPSGVLAAGLDRYFRDFDSGANRWGDYSALALDPNDNSTFWVYNMYALNRGTVFTDPPSLADEDGRWGTRWGKFALAPVNNPPPTVTDVYVDSSTAWTNAFRTFLENNNLGTSALGYRVPGGANQLLALPFNNVNRVRVQFSEDVTVDQADLAVRGLTVANYAFAAANGFAYDPATFVATWTFNNNVGRDKILLDLNGETAGGGVSDGTNLLDGEWTAQGGDTFPSGNGTAGGDFRFQINFLPGDANGSGVVDVSDLGILSTNFNQTPRGPRAGDFNGSAAVDVSDLGILSTFFNQSLPAGTPAAPVTLRRVLPASAAVRPVTALFSTPSNTARGRAMRELAAALA
jgi:hypothetical protein